MLRRGPFPWRALAAPWLAAVWLLAAAPPAHAGCGCDHPPPAFAPVMPAFAPPGASVLINLDGAPLTWGASYDVTFAPSQGPNADAVKVMNGKKTVQNLDVSHFTVLSPLAVVPSQGGALEAVDLDAAVTTDGTLLLPVNVRHVQQAMQFAIQFTDLALEFGPDDVVFHNLDGIDLTLFTLAVEGQTEMQWGSYYGWEVDEDAGISGVVYDNKVRRSGQPSRAGISGVVYDNKVRRSGQPSRSSDVLTYWRHEFETYTAAHQPGASHEVSGGLHPDLTMHVNHGHLVLAIQGMVRNAKHPDDPSKMSPLSPGRVRVNVQMLGVPAEGPIEPDEMTSQLAAQTSFAAFGAPESHFDEFASSLLLKSSSSGSDSTRLLDSSLMLYDSVQSMAY
jgi:hypothetical protein